MNRSRLQIDKYSTDVELLQCSRENPVTGQTAREKFRITVFFVAVHFRASPLPSVPRVSAPPGTVPIGGYSVLGSKRPANRVSEIVWEDLDVEVDFRRACFIKASKPVVTSEETSTCHKQNVVGWRRDVYRAAKSDSI
ncbi:hypothetical protein EVAR_83391_1 [Eumeta japonica]|uniref:Uncharacterized protein n=1 Tax=Eumeta variegata TaxID=151549 RepID=A0A4C1TYE9_EUMVA|nr:hypothetical protein EVAR_83391_1 [Eumeta japonica]